MRKMAMAAGILLVLMSLGGTAEAVPTLTGQVNFAGGFTTNSSDLATATQINFVGQVVNIPLTGSFAGVPPFATPVTFASPLNLTGFAPVTDFWTFVAGGLTYHFDLLTLSVVTQTSSVLALFGTGTMYVTNGATLVYAETNSRFALTTQGFGNSEVGYGYSAATEAVPEPGTLLLIGSGLAGLALRRRRKA